MSDLVVISYQSEAEAISMRAKLLDLQRRYLVNMEDVVIATRNEKGKVHLHQTYSLTSAGAWGGGFWGMLLGFLFMTPLLGAAIGAGVGALSGRFSDIGINDKFMKDITMSFRPGTSALFILFREVKAEKALPEIEMMKGTGKIMQTTLDADREERLREAIEKMDSPVVASMSTSPQSTSLESLPH